MRMGRFSRSWYVGTIILSFLTFGIFDAECFVTNVHVARCAHLRKRTSWLDWLTDTRSQGGRQRAIGAFAEAAQRRSCRVVDAAPRAAGVGRPARLKGRKKEGTSCPEESVGVMGDFGDDFGAFGAVPSAPVIVGAIDDWDALSVPAAPPEIPVFTSEFDEEFDAFKSNSNLHQLGATQEVAEAKVI